MRRLRRQLVANDIYRSTDLPSVRSVCSLLARRSYRASEDGIDNIHFWRAVSLVKWVKLARPVGTCTVPPKVCTDVRIIYIISR